MSSAEFSEWAVFYEMDPWGPDRDNWHAATIASTLIRVNGGPAAKKVQPADFMHRPWIEPMDPDERVEAQVAAFMAQF